MPVERLRPNDLLYYLIAFDANGCERTDDPDGLMSRQVLGTLCGEPFTDVFLLSHGWKGDVPGAREQYNRWIGAMTECADDIEHMRQTHPGFRPLLIGLHWPSLPWGDEELGGGSAVSFDAMARSPIEDLLQRYAGRIADTPAARAALRTIFGAAEEDIAPDTLPEAVRSAYQVLDREANLGSEGVGAAPGADREPFDPEEHYQAAREEAVSFTGRDFLGGLLSPLMQLSFWTMKARACKFGEKGAHTLLQQMLAARSGVRFHLMGHSLGCIVVSAAVAGPAGGSGLERPVDSLALVQGALSLWSYCPNIPYGRGRPGYFHRIIAERRVAGPIIATQSEYDLAVGKWYRLSAAAARQIAFAPGEWPEYGGVGVFGIRGLDSGTEDSPLLPLHAAYGFEPNTIYNLECSQIIREGEGASGAHSDICHPEVAHAVWEAAGK